MRESRGRYLSVVGLLLAYCLLRLHDLTALPVFVDESFHIETAQRFWDGQVLASASHGRLLRVWYNAILGPFPPGAAWVTRAGTILVCMLGVAAFYRLGRSFSSHAAGVVGIVLLTITPYLVFYERMALADPLLSALSVVAVLFAWRLVKTAGWKAAFLLGAAIALVILAKAPGIVWLPLPLVSMILVKGVPWRRRALLAFTSYGALALVWGPLLILLDLKGYNYFGLASVFVGGVDQTIVERTSANLRLMWTMNRHYMGLPVILLAVLGGVFWLRRQPRGALFALLVLGMAAGGAAAFGHHVNSRYALNQVIWVLLPLMVGAGFVMEQGRAARLLVICGLAIWSIVFYLPFQLAAWNEPESLVLAGNDTAEYQIGEASGFGYGEVGHVLKSLGEVGPTLGFVANCQTLRLEAYPVEVTCPDIHWDGTSQRAIIALAEEAAAKGPAIVVGEHLPYIDLSELPQPHTVVAEIERQGGRPLFVFELQRGAVSSQY